MEACQVHQPQNECILAYSRSNRGMSNTELQNFIDRTLRLLHWSHQTRHVDGLPQREIGIP